MIPDEFGGYVAAATIGAVNAGRFIAAPVLALLACSGHEPPQLPQSQSTQPVIPRATAGAEPAGPSGDACVVDCSEREDGYQWAQRSGIDDPTDCAGNSESFIVGCIAYAEEQARMGPTSDRKRQGSQ